MIKGMFGGALMVALLIGGLLVWGKLSGHHWGSERGFGMTLGDSETKFDDSDRSGGVTLAEATGTAPSNTEDHQHSEGMTHDMSAMDMQGTGVPNEPGQGAFAALSEIVEMLIADPETNWSSVNITGLREHLVDMDMLITNAEVISTEIDGGLEMTVSLSGPGGGSVSRMVPAHGPVLAAETGWQSTVKMTDSNAIWRVVSPDNADQIRALGFFGMMAMGDHHRAHHIGMANGAMVH